MRSAFKHNSEAIDSCGAGWEFPAADLLSEPRGYRVTRLLLLIPLSMLVPVMAAYSLSWRMQHDAPLMMYFGWLQDAHGFVPYRDIFDMNMPGAHIAYMLIGKLLGYSDL